jgi:hypothetical protein
VASPRGRSISSESTDRHDAGRLLEAEDLAEHVVNSSDLAGFQHEERRLDGTAGIGDSRDEDDLGDWRHDIGRRCHGAARQVGADTIARRQRDGVGAGVGVGVGVTRILIGRGVAVAEVPRPAGGFAGGRVAELDRRADHGLRRVELEGGGRRFGRGCHGGHGQRRTISLAGGLAGVEALASDGDQLWGGVQGFWSPQPGEGNLDFGTFDPTTGDRDPAFFIPFQIFDVSPSDFVVLPRQPTGPAIPTMTAHGAAMLVLLMAVAGFGLNRPRTI